MLNLFKVFAFLALLLQGGAQINNDPLPLIQINTPCGIDTYQPHNNTRIIDIRRYEVAKRPYLLMAKFFSNGEELVDNALWNEDQAVIDVDVCQTRSN